MENRNNKEKEITNQQTPNPISGFWSGVANFFKQARPKESTPISAKPEETTRSSKQRIKVLEHVITHVRKLNQQLGDQIDDLKHQKTELEDKIVKLNHEFQHISNQDIRSTLMHDDSNQTMEDINHAQQLLFDKYKHLDSIDREISTLGIKQTEAKKAFEIEWLETQNCDFPNSKKTYEKYNGIGPEKTALEHERKNLQSEIDLQKKELNQFVSTFNDQIAPTQSPERYQAQIEFMLYNTQNRVNVLDRRITDRKEQIRQHNQQIIEFDKELTALSKIHNTTRLGSPAIAQTSTSDLQQKLKTFNITQVSFTDIAKLPSHQQTQSQTTHKSKKGIHR